MKSLDVIGDSFSDEEHLKQSNTQTRKDENKTYLELLREETWEINNYSWHGIGATQAIERVNNINIRSDYLLFILPQIKRIKFKNYTDDNVTLMYVKYKNNNLPVEFMTDYNAVYSTTLLEMYDTLCLTYVFNFCQNYKKTRSTNKNGVDCSQMLSVNRSHVVPHCWASKELVLKTETIISKDSIASLTSQKELTRV